MLPPGMSGTAPRRAAPFINFLRFHSSFEAISLS
jgi:hypothetical protein